MRLTLAKIAAYIFVVVVILPALLVRGCSYTPPVKQPDRPQAQVSLRVFVVGKGIVTMDLEDYVRGVVAAEMPANFDLEALKAQAVAARTKAMRTAVKFGGKGCQFHPGADLCTDPAHVQGWLSPDEMRKKWSLLQYLRFSRKFTRAVAETRGEIITYQGEPIDAVYHSTSGGATENAEDVWGKYVPYLRSVPCPYDRNSPRYRETKDFTVAQLQAKLGVRLNLTAMARAAADDAISVTARSQTGRVKEVQVGRKVLKGTDFRQLLDLRSTRFTWEVVGGKVRFTTIGYGHGVGLCQYGADGQARTGKTYREILRYYYTGVEVKQLIIPGFT